MFIKHLSLAHFRNYETAEVELQKGVNLFVGPNGQGKTNLAEAIRYLSTLSSHRVAGYIPMIKQGAAQAVVRALASFDDRDVLLELELNRDTPNKVRVNKSPAQKVRDILGYVNSVTFAPEDLDIIKRDPSNRRAFIDELVVQVWPRFAGVYGDYERVLKQRNTLLKTARQTGAKGSALSTLDAWDQSLVAYGSEIIAARVDLIERLRPHLFAAYQSIAIANNEPKILIKSSLLSATIAHYLDEEANFATAEFEVNQAEFLNTGDRAEIEELFRLKLQSVRNKELERGITLVGPHRDDLVLLLGSLPAKGYASHGESWSYALALRLASIALLRAETRSGDPILILDDVFAELDAGRRERLAQMVKENEQVLITAAVAEDIPKDLIATVFHVKAGVVTSGE
ncbi:DNA replication/repair protein RecF [Rhodoluna lacicola]|uniref:DNA replication/repair protein RecF n=1 Tax=Rhodoluna lacicola TaxID=529884 RepID=UPI002230E259|nr:DNA replication/repair protein RecF [Rhodoluna lacicola]BDS49741.1 DNA replication and repair protein RecF [Rhodoluna lacicola]